MRNIQKSTRPSSRRRENAAAIVKASPPGALTKGPDRKFPGLHPPPGGATSRSLSTNRRFAFPILALLAALAVGLLFLLPGGPLHAQQTAETYYHHENDMGPVVTLTANDPEDVTHIYWSFLTDATGDQDLPGGNATDDIGDLDIAHRAFFKVEDGVLSFEAKPDYEAGTPAPDDRMYKVVVQASDGGQMTWVQYFKVTVVVLDVEEQGKVTWTVNPDGTANGEAAGQNLLEFQAGAVLTATVTDPDGLPADDNDTWKWYRSSRNTGPWTMITSGDPAVPVITADYTASDHAENNDVGMYLRAVATYTDRRGDGKTAEFVSPHTVKATKVEDNSVPKFAPTAVERDIQEGPAGRNVGASVTATDADNDVLNYTLVTNVGDFFEIDQLTGQITTAALLDYENPGTDWATADDGTTKTIDVTVRATDSAGGNTVENGAPVDATVTITLLNVNEAPDFGVESRTLDSPANIQGMAADMAEEGVGRPMGGPSRSFRLHGYRPGGSRHQRGQVEPGGIRRGQVQAHRRR